MKAKIAVLLIVVLVMAGFVLPAPASAQTGSGFIATVKVDRLNVRRGPRAKGAVLGELTRESTVELIGRNRVSSWVEAITPFGIGWIDARFISVNKSIVGLPVSLGLPFATVVDAVTVFARRGPDENYAIVARYTRGAELDVIGLHTNNTHVEVETPKGAAWLPIKSVVVEGDISLLEDTDIYVLPLAKINAYRVNVRAEPSERSRIIGKVGLAEAYEISAYNAKAGWAKIRGPFGTGWVAIRFIRVIGDLEALNRTRPQAELPSRTQ
jgi:uncharacterized protein YgiM (DUF1202 family)